MQKYTPQYWDKRPELGDALAKFAAQELFASEIASEMNALFGLELTKNAIIGRCRRCNINLHHRGKYQRLGRLGAEARWKK
jgi:hypothetical protein